jgi:hypothetical protein
MKNPPRDPVREDRIHNEAVVDAGHDAEALAWYYHLEKSVPRSRQGAWL